MNNSMFVGNLTADPVIREAASGNKRATFSVAVNEGDKDKGTEKTHFVNCTAFGTLGENMAGSLHKGQRVIVAGRLDTYRKDVQVDGKDVSLTMVNFIASAVGPDLRWATANVAKVARDSYDDGDEAPARSASAKPAQAKAKASEEDVF